MKEWAPSLPQRPHVLLTRTTTRAARGWAFACAHANWIWHKKQSDGEGSTLTATLAGPPTAVPLCQGSALMASAAPAVQIVDLQTYDPPDKVDTAPATTTYCCGRCKSDTGCCGPCRFPCTPRRKRACIALVVFLAAAAVAIIICAVYFTWPKPKVGVRIQHVVGTPLSTARITSGGRRLLQTTASLAPSSAQASASECAYAQARSWDASQHSFSPP